MLVPSIDLMDGKAVQLRRGKDRVLTSDRDPGDLAREFNRYGEVAVIDLDAALGTGDNLDLVRRLCRVADVRAGGGVRDEARGRALLRAGARKIIVGTAAEPGLLGRFPAEKTIVALDHRKGSVVDKGWTRDTGESLFERAERLRPFCGGFLVTFVEDEGGLGGMDLEGVKEARDRLGLDVTVAGGVASAAEAAAISRLGVDVQVGMSLYTGKLDPVEAVIQAIDFEKSPLVPTIAQDEAGQVLMLAYSSPASLARALAEGKGIYYSRSRREIWEKGATSGHVQELLSCRADCDRDALLFTVRQTGPACHTGSYSCFGGKRFSPHRLFEVLAQRKRDAPEGSYSATLFADRDKLLRKLMEEAFEVTRASTEEEFAWELGDVLYFASVIAVDEGIPWEAVVSELAGRMKGEGGKG